MKKLAALLLLSTMLYAQSPAKEPTAAEVKLQLAQKDLTIAQMKMQIAQLQAQLVQNFGQQAQQELIAAQKAVDDATPKPEVKK